MKQMGIRVLICMTVLLAGVLPVHAQTATPVPTPVVDESNANIISGDTADFRFNLSQSKQVIAHLVADAQGVLPGLPSSFTNAVFEWAAEVFPVATHNLMDMLVYKTQLEASNPKLMPDNIQLEITPEISPMYVSKTSRLCVYGGNGSLAVNQVSSRRIISNDETESHMIQGMDQFGQSINSAFNQLAPRPDQNYNASSEYVKLEDPWGCEKEDSGEKMVKLSQNVSGLNLFGTAGSPIKTFLNAADYIVSSVDSIVNGVLTRDVTANVSQTGFIRFTSLLPRAPTICSNIRGCTTEDMANIRYLTDAQKQELEDRHGLNQTYETEVNPIPTVPINGNRENTYSTSQGGGGITQTIDTYIPMTNKLKEGWDYNNCAVMFNDTQQDYLPQAKEVIADAGTSQLAANNSNVLQATATGPTPICTYDGSTPTPIP